MNKSFAFLSLACAMSLATAAGAQEIGETAPEAEAPSEPAAAPATEEAAVNESVEVSPAAGDKKIRLGLRLGYGIPLGSTMEGSKLSDAYSGQVPIWVDAGYMVTPQLMVGAYFQYGIAFVADDGCPEGADCSGSDIRFGLQAQYHLAQAPRQTDPWFGLGIGYEIASYSAEAGGVELDGSVKGFEFLNLQGGVDFPVGDALMIGPFASFSLGQYSSLSSGDESADIEEKALHEWLVLGVKGTFSL